MNPFEKLASTNPTRIESADHLLLLGKQAAKRYLSKEASSLTDAITETVRGTPLNAHQVQRVAEAANQATWNEAFHVGGNRDFQFKVADAQDILKALDVPVPQVHVYEDSSYNASPPLGEVPDDEALLEAFKTASDVPDYEHLNPGQGLVQEHAKFASARDLAQHGVDLLVPRLQESRDQFYDLFKQAHLNEGAGILQIAQAVAQAVESSAFAADLCKVAAARLIGEGVRFDQKREQEKIASAFIVSSDHPLMQEAALLEKLAYSLMHAQGVHHQFTQAAHITKTASLRGHKP